MHVIKSDGSVTRLNGNPTLVNIAQTEKANLETIKKLSAAKQAEFGVYDVATIPPEGQRWTGTFDGSVTPPVAVFENITIESIESKRNTSSLTRREFCLALAKTNILTSSDALDAAKGEWPAAMFTFLSYLTPEQSIDAQIEWAATAQIDRLHPFVLSMGSWLSLTDVEVDTIFGIT